MWQLRLAGSGVGPDYPERPGEPDCSYFIKTGTCGYGDRCRFNHPHSLAAVRSSSFRIILSDFGF